MPGDTKRRRAPCISIPTHLRLLTVICSHKFIKKSIDNILKQYNYSIEDNNIIMAIKRRSAANNNKTAATKKDDLPIFLKKVRIIFY